MPGRDPGTSVYPAVIFVIGVVPEGYSDMSSGRATEIVCTISLAVQNTIEAPVASR